ncbi:MAG: 4Fe-4S dicluster domain-containing protein [Rhodospirillales bacterium]|nr:MAG: 4Fe-4S dicluster domain-containing protein [Rhodospirillales bacterium]
MYFGKLKEAKGTVHINQNWCKGCGFCVNFCPTKVLVLSKDYNAKGYHPPEVQDADKCRDCKFCELICPEFAIYVSAVPNDGDEDKETHGA